MNINKWTDEELSSTRDKLDAWCLKHATPSWGNRMWLLTALLGAVAISTGVVFIFFDGISAMSIILIILGGITCYSWYKSEKQRKINMNFLKEIKVEIARRTKRKNEKPVS
jgi:hypothetical protein